MALLTISARIADADADDVFGRLCDFGVYPRFTDAVRAVDIRRIDARTSESSWSVNFRNGVMCWTERDTVDPVRRRLTFEQTDGDYETFLGSWKVEVGRVEVGSVVVVVFTCQFDLGMPSIGAMINALARDALTENITLILRGLYGASIVVTAEHQDQERAPG